jgi:peptidoglycan/LPS O-acetylase OafA/YrhL
VFFLVSGYIVPASLERKGSVRSFWVSQVYRLYPLYLFAVGAMIVLWVTGIGSLSGMDSDPVTSPFADVFMLQSVPWALGNRFPGDPNNRVLRTFLQVRGMSRDRRRDRFT